MLVESEDMEPRDIIHVDGDAILRRLSRICVSGQEVEEHSIGTVIELFWRLYVDIASKDIAEN